MNYEWLFSFIAFAEHLNFTHAAKSLRVSQPALHVQIKKLTELVGRPLYVRSGRALRLTEEGKQLAAFGREARERGDHALAQARGAFSAGPVVLAAGQGAFLYLLGDVVRRARKEKLRLLAMSGPDAMQAVRDARAHLCVAATEMPPADLTLEVLRAVGQHVILPTSHRLAKRRTLRPRDLTAEAIIVAPLGSPHRTMIAQTLQVGGCDWKVAVEVTGWELMLRFAQYGVGIAIVNDFCEPPKGMAAVPLDGSPSTTYYLARRPGPMVQAVAALHDQILESVRDR